MTFRIHCNECNADVEVQTFLDEAELKEALGNDAEIKVMHTSAHGDHAWLLNQEGKDRLRHAMATGAA
jgi:hypothetical protein